MAIAITVTPSTGTAATTFHHVEVSGLDDTDFSTYDSTPDANSTEPYRAEVSLTYYFQFSEGGLIKGRSHVFTPDSSTGKAVWDSVMFPDAGTYTVSVHRSTTGATLKSTSVVVS